MLNFSHRSLGSAAALVGLAATVPFSIVAPVSAQPAYFADTSSYWAQPFIQALAKKQVIAGFPDGTFKPNQPVDRAEFAAMIQKAFNQKPIRQSGGFTDVPQDYWAASAIEEAYETGFMVGLPGNSFLPNVKIPKTQALVALASGLGLTSGSTPATNLNNYYTDAAQIPAYGMNGIAAATNANIVVNYPNVKVLNPTELLSRGEAAALLHQALVKQGAIPPLASNVEGSQYIAGPTTK